MARKKSTRTTRGRMKKTPRSHASWRGALTFGLVTFPVEAFNALDPLKGDIRFHQIHADCHERIHHQKVCPVHGEVTNAEIVSGYEYKNGKYVELDPEELASLRTESDKALKIEAFVSPATVDPLYFDGRMYYLMPAGPAAQEPYAVIVEAMDREERYGVGHLIFSGKDQIVLIRALDGILHMGFLHYETEIRAPKKVAAALKKPGNITRQVRLAQTLVEEWSQDNFDYARYENKYRDKVKELIDSKLCGEDIAAPAAEEPAPTLNLMEALKQSVKARGTARREHRGRRARRSA